MNYKLILSSILTTAILTSSTAFANQNMKDNISHQNYSDNATDFLNTMELNNNLKFLHHDEMVKPVVAWNIENIKLKHKISNKEFYKKMNKLAIQSKNSLSYTNYNQKNINNAERQPLIIFNNNIDNSNILNMFKKSKVNGIFKIVESNIKTSSAYIEANINANKINKTNHVIHDKSVDININQSLKVKSFIYNDNLIHTNILLKNKFLGKNETLNINPSEKQGESQTIGVMDTKSLQGDYNMSINGMIVIKVNDNNIIILRPSKTYIHEKINIQPLQNYKPIQHGRKHCHMNMMNMSKKQNKHCCPMCHHKKYKHIKTKVNQNKLSKQ